MAFPDPVTLSSDNADYRNGPWYTKNDIYPGVTLVNGVDFTSSVTVQPAFFPAQTTASWAWPADEPVSSYNAVVYGADERDSGINAISGMPASSKIDDLTTFATTFDVTVNAQPDEYNLLLESFLYSDALCTWPPLAEVGIMGHTTQNLGTLVGAFNAGGVTGSLYSMPITVGDDSWTFYIIKPSTDISAGTIDIKAVLLAVKAAGLITGQEYVGSWRSGVEPVGGAGSMSINSLSVTLL